MRIRELPLEDDSFPPRPRSCRNRTPTPTAGLRLDVMFEWLARMPSGARACARSPAASTSDPAEVSRVRGQAAFALPGAFRRDCSQRKLHPDPIGSDTCCRRARRDAGWRGRPRRAHTCWRVPMTSPPGEPASALPRERGAPDGRFLGRPAGPDGAHDAPLVSWTSSRARLGRRPLSRPPPAPGPLPAPLREERCVLLHPRCLPSMCRPIRRQALARPRSGVGQLSTCCPQPVECCCRRLCVPCVSHRR